MGEEKVEEALQSESNANEEYSFPALRFDVPPHRTYHFHRQFISPTNPNSFLKAVKWSPDGSSFLTSSDDNTLRLFTPPSSETAAPVSASHDDDSFAANVVMHEGESIHDFCWYPYMSSSDLVTNVFATTTRDHPIHLWDATSGQLRCTYRAYDAMDEITAAFSIAFNPAGNKEDNMELLYVLHGQEGGITHVQFSRDGNYLYTGGRKDPYILCWDVRKSVDCVYKLYRSSANTNQRILFDIDPSGQHLGTGGQDGLVHIYNLQTGQWVSSFEAALDTVNGFSFHPFLPHAVSSSGHRRFVIPDDDNKELCLSGNENCVSVWSFCYDSTMETDLKNNGSFNNQSESDYLD
ncbi:telomerase Cajal body protein 1 isoform X2 [Cajanus cajan]|uniref:telomerase Cajal body protein 1 isoform X2 n=1 Tax=Cajanus cajan TaxID=3821 RepID=UPI00098DACCE|nr:telomerase Cajal body protein 1 isoform X2 [Cajanus cajan]